MSRILVVETASPLRVRKKLDELRRRNPEHPPEITVLCSDDRKTIAFFAECPGVRVVPLEIDHRREILGTLAGEKFDELHLFWSGERRYRSAKFDALKLKALVTWIDAGDGNVFRLTWKACLRFALFRRKHRLPSDHYEFVLPPRAADPVEYYDGEKVLLLQSAEPRHVLRALETLKKERIFREPRFEIFCRNRPEILRHFEGNPDLQSVIPHSETRRAAQHLRALRARRFDAVVVFFTGDPSYWKLKYFAFLLGARHKLIFNENGDCFFFSLGTWLALLSRRLGERSLSGTPSRWTYQARLLVFLGLKVLVFPLRVAWLLLVWLRLRIAG